MPRSPHLRSPLKREDKKENALKLQMPESISEAETKVDYYLQRAFAKERHAQELLLM